MRTLRKLLVTLVGGLSLTYLTMSGLAHVVNAIRFFLAGYGIAAIHLSIFILISVAVWSLVDAKA